MKDTISYNVESACHPEAQIMFEVDIEVDPAGKTTWPQGAELEAPCPVCGRRYAAMNKGPELRVRVLDVDNPAITYTLLDEDLG